MFFVSEYNFQYYGITTADYSSFPEDTPFIDRTKSVTDSYRREMVSYLNKQGISEPIITDEQILILWKNTPKYHFSSDISTHLIYAFAVNAKNEHKGSQLILPSPDVLAEGDMVQFMQRFSLIANNTGIIPEFISDSCLPAYTESMLGNVENAGIQQLSKGHKDDALFSSVLIGAYIDNRNEEILKQLLQYTDSLLALTNNRIDTTLLENEFISYYFNWQAGNLPAETCCKELGNLSKASFYKYADEFEHCPEYAEYLKLYHAVLSSIAKKGVIPDIDEFSSNYLALCPLYDLDKIYAGKMEMCRLYNLASIFDLDRIKLAVDKKIEIRERKKQKRS